MICKSNSGATSEQKTDCKSGGALENERTGVACSAEGLPPLALDRDLILESQLTHVVLNLYIGIDARYLPRRVAGRTPELVHHHVHCGVGDTPWRPNRQDRRIDQPVSIDLGNGAVDAVHHFQANETRERGNPICGGTPSVEQPGLEDGREPRQLVLVREDVIVA
jgi:hypothetical protein